MAPFPLSVEPVAPVGIALTNETTNTSSAISEFREVPLKILGGDIAEYIAIFIVAVKKRRLDLGGH